MENYLFVVFSAGAPISSRAFSGSGDFLSAARLYLEVRYAIMSAFHNDPALELYCEVWQYVTHDEMKKIITIF